MPRKRYRLGPDIDLDEEVVLDAGGERITEARAREMAAYALDEGRQTGLPKASSGDRLVGDAGEAAGGDEPG